MRALVVEDDEYKATQLQPLLRGTSEVVLVHSVRDAVVATLTDEFSAVVLDMALPTFTRSPVSSSGTAQAQGGMEVIRALRSRRSQVPVILVSQYPDLELDGNFVALDLCPCMLRSRYNVNVVGSVLFDFESRTWVSKFYELWEQACGS